MTDALLLCRVQESKKRKREKRNKGGQAHGETGKATDRKWQEWCRA